MFLALITFNLIITNVPILKQNFTRNGSHLVSLSSDTSFRQINLESASAYSLEYTSFREHKGRVNCFSPYYDYDVNAKHPVLPKDEVILDYEMDEVQNINPNLDYRGEVYLVNRKGFVDSYRFSPNVVIVSIQVLENDTLVLNQNYMKGWRVDSPGKMVKPYEGKISVDVTPEESKVKFYYLPNSFIIGLITSLLTFLFIVILYIPSHIRRKIYDLIKS